MPNPIDSRDSVALQAFLDRMVAPCSPGVPRMVETAYTGTFEYCAPVQRAKGGEAIKRQMKIWKCLMCTHQY